MRERSSWWWLLGGALVAAVLFVPRKVWGYVRGSRVELDLADIGGGYQLGKDAAAAYLRMAAAALAAGITLRVNSAFRSMAEQTRLYALYLAGGNLAAKPGYSNHQSGIAVDIDSYDAQGRPNAASYWLAQNAGRFGFKRTVPEELWHWEYLP